MAWFETTLQCRRRLGPILTCLGGVLGVDVDRFSPIGPRGGQTQMI